MKTYEMKNGATKIIKMSDLAGSREIAELKKALANGNLYEELIIDLTDVSYLDQNIIDLLINFNALKQRLRLVNPNALVSKMLEARHLDRMYEIQHIYPTVW